MQLEVAQTSQLNKAQYFLSCVCASACAWKGLFARFNSSETTGPTNIKLNLIDHLPGVSVIRGWQRHDDVIIKDIFFNCIY